MSAEIVNWETVVALAQRFPAVEVSTSYGTPALKVKKKLMVRLWEDGETLVVRVDLNERPFVMQEDPNVYFLTDHYVGYPAMLVRLLKASREQIEERLEDAWRFVAPDRLIAEYDSAAGSD